MVCLIHCLKHTVAIYFNSLQCTILNFYRKLMVFYPSHSALVGSTALNIILVNPDTVSSSCSTALNIILVHPDTVSFSRSTGKHSMLNDNNCSSQKSIIFSKFYQNSMRILPITSLKQKL